jgi:tetratricopeptide (TPR) repeat protein
MNWRPATRHFLEAFRLDSSFVQAALWAMEDADSATIRTLLRVVGAKREQLQPLDRLRYDHRVAYYDRDLERAYQIAGDMVKIAPTSQMALHAYAMAAFNTRRYVEAAETFKRMKLADEATAPYVGFYNQVGMAFHHAGRFRDQLKVVEIGMREQATDYSVCLDKAAALAALRRVKELSALATTCASRHPEDSVGLLMDLHDYTARELLIHEQPQHAQNYFNKAIAIAERLYAARKLSEVNLAAQYYRAGRFEKASPLYETLRRQADIRPIQIGPAVVIAAHLKDTASVNWFRTLLDTMPGKKRPKPLSRAHLAMAEHREEEAMRLLEEFADDGGLVVLQLYGARAFEPLWKSPRWKALFTRQYPSTPP